MFLPGLCRREFLRRMALQALQRRLGQPLLARILERLHSDAIAAFPGLQELEKIDPALTLGAAKPGEEVVPNLGDVAVLALMPRPRMIDRDEGADRQANLQQPILLRKERFVVVAEEGIDLPHGEVDAPFEQLLAQ